LRSLGQPLPNWTSRVHSSDAADHSRAHNVRTDGQPNHHADNWRPHDGQTDYARADNSCTHDGGTDRTNDGSDNHTHHTDVGPIVVTNGCAYISADHGADIIANIIPDRDANGGANGKPDAIANELANRIANRYTNACTDSGAFTSANCCADTIADRTTNFNSE
jgi:hypothetical protein